MTPLNDATIAQVRAANPAASTWVSANAGSGKTRVLTDRVARLLLRGTEPQKILCLTYTKAAASHMQNQLFDRLGKWAMLDDGDLRETLAVLGEATEKISGANLRNARTLFARALETPGGLKIQTIHSFCAALLRRFPLESHVSPQFQEMDDRGGLKLRAEILETLADGLQRQAMDGMARYLSGEDPDSLMQEIARNRTQFENPKSADDIWQEMGLSPGYAEADVLAEAFPEWADEVLPDLCTILLTGKTTDVKNAKKLSDIDLSSPSIDALRRLESVFLFGPTAKNNPDGAKIGAVPTKDLGQDHPDLMDAIHPWMLRVKTARQKRRALEAARKTAALHDFAAVFLDEYAARKLQNGWLDFDDLILKARDLLTDSATAQWVLFRLDGGIDHILVDEAQDTSPPQWSVITKLAEEFTSGRGARDVERTIFVVGDEKQSIYSFQGADPAEFGRMRDHFAAHLDQIESRLERSNLLFSFRSAAPILQLADAVLQAQDQTQVADSTLHRAFHDQLPGRVDLWPFLPKTGDEQENDWFDPVDLPSPEDPARILAAQIADQIADLIKTGTKIQTTTDTRPLAAGDFLILVQKRSDLFHEIITALKSCEVPVAGADRLKIGAELAVKDLLAMLSFMSLPEDDLSLACAMRSPIIGLSEIELYKLAAGRKASLWQSLRSQKDAFSECFALLNALLGEVDFQRPFELLETILTTHGGRQSLIGRLGAEAEDGIDALLNEALQYEQSEAPSLTGFLRWMETGNVVIKRQLDTASDQVRVMTVHGAKGLESPVVLLPDTAKRTFTSRDNLARLDSGLPIWKTGSDDSILAVKEARDLQNNLQQKENQRLLYVALTRAENWLIVCGAGDPGKTADSWYNQIETAMGVLGAQPVKLAAGQGHRLQSANWVDGHGTMGKRVDTSENELPLWVVKSVPSLPATQKTLSPSELGGAKVVGESSETPKAIDAKMRGRQIHVLLEHLPNTPKDTWHDGAQSLLSNGQDQADQAEIISLLNEVTPLLTNPSLAHLFKPDTLAEVAITARLKHFDNQVIYGFIDRLIVGKSHVLAVDFKSNVVVPERAQDVPDGIIQQMAAYFAALSAIYPDRAIKTAILWTKPGILMELPHDIVTQSFKSAPTS